jgi:alpha-L-rhamnosidase
VARNVADNVKERKVHLTTGFLGTQFILPMLSDYGYHDLAYQLATQRTYPSWGYMIDRGATTMWELWNSDQQGPDMNSRNHYAYGTVGEWFFGYLAGIRPDEAAPGFKKTIIAPRPAGNLQWAEGNLETLYGTVMSRWERKGSSMVFSVTVPANSVAEVRIPVMGRSNYSISEGGNALVKAGKQAGKIPAVEVVTAGQNEAILNVGAGNYHFTLL